MKRKAFILIIICIVILGIVMVKKAYMSVHIPNVLIDYDIITTNEVYNQKDIKRVDAVKMLLNVLGGVTETSIEMAQMLEHPVFADEYINFMDANDENDKDVGYMCIAANIIIPNEQYFDKPLMRCYDNITYQEALIYCIRCLEENGIAEDGKVNNKDVMHIALKNKLIGIFDYKWLKNIESAIPGADYCKLMYKLLNSNRYMYRYDVETEKDSFNHNISEYRCDYVRSVTYKEYLDNPYKYRNSELYY